MGKLGNSIERSKNGGAQFGFWATIVTIIVFIGILVMVKLDSLGTSMLYFVVAAFICLAVYMYFKAKTEIDIREHGIYVRTIRKKHEILFDEIAKFDKTKRVGKSGTVVIVFYLLVIEKKDGERITFPFKVSKDFLAKLINVSNIFE